MAKSNWDVFEEKLEALVNNGFFHYEVFDMTGEENADKRIVSCVFEDEVLDM